MSKFAEKVVVDLKGFAQLHGADRFRLVVELLQNAFDEKVTRVDMTFTKLPGEPTALVRVVDDGPGFRDLRDAYTLFKSSYKKNDPTKRGRFNMGEKQIISIAKALRINTTSGTVLFDEEGREIRSDERREVGTMVEGSLHYNKKDFDLAMTHVRRVIVPEGVQFYLNGEYVEPLPPVKSFEMVLPTKAANDAGELISTRRKTEVRLYKVAPCDKPWIYEMGIPVQKLKSSDPYHIDIQQKIPLNMNRSVVSEKYLARLRTGILNNTYNLLSEESVNDTWVYQAMSRPEVSLEAVETIVKHTYGDKVVSRSLQDTEANSTAVAKGFNIIEGRALPKTAWKVLKETESVKSAGDMFPTQSKETSKTTKFIDKRDWTHSMHLISSLAKEMAKKLRKIQLDVLWMEDPNASAVADYCKATKMMRFNKSYMSDHFTGMGEKFTEDTVGLIIHELGHDVESNHLSARYHEALTTLAAQAVTLAMVSPEVFSTDYHKSLVGLRKVL